eukprot:TRINITY_DN24776_c0_g1_i1.p1 TRINITY_DN24776_c0_g1~~TRINITY_DN24776_c0_g1_i1.p1  ORF type:complete len:125 (+),score=11.66 TRINITY_DN24776_c0_g1_i1:17-391(+)
MLRLVIYVSFYHFTVLYALSYFFFFLMRRRPPRTTLSSSSAASDVYKRQVLTIDNNQVLRTSSHQSTGWADLGEDTKEGTPAISVATSEHNATVAPPPPTQQQSRFSPVDGTDLDIPIDFDGMD